MSFLAQFDQTTDPQARMQLFFGALLVDWRALFAELRASRPILDLPLMTVLSRCADVVDLLSRPETFAVTYRPHMDPSVGPFMLARDGAAQNWRDKAAGIGSAMFEPDVFPDPDAFTVRPRNLYRHVGFGAHTCLGQYVAYEIVPETIRQILRVPGVYILPDGGSAVDTRGGPFAESFKLGFGVSHG